MTGRFAVIDVKMKPQGLVLFLLLYSPETKEKRGLSVKKKILIIDDNRDLCRIMADILRCERFVVSIAHDGKTGLPLLRKRKFDLMIMDYNLPDSKGLNVLYKARKIRSLIPIIMISASPNEYFIERAFRAGIAAFIPKPFGIMTLTGVVKEDLKTQKNSDSQ